MEHWLAGTPSVHNWYPFPNVCVSYNYVGGYVSFCYFYFQQEIKFWLIHYGEYDLSPKQLRLLD